MEVLAARPEARRGARASGLTSPTVSTHLDLAVWRPEVSWGPATSWEMPLRLLVLASGRLSSGKGVTTGPGSPPDLWHGAELLRHLQPPVPACPGSCLLGRRLGQGVPSFLTSDLTCFLIKTRI